MAENDAPPSHRIAGRDDEHRTAFVEDREAILLAVCDAGIVFLPGAAGTVQEVFQDACENYYADPATVAPMVLVGHDYWTRTLPAWPLLKRLANDRHMEAHVHLVDSVSEAAALFG